MTVPDTQPTSKNDPVRCPSCSFLCTPEDTFCPRCGQRLHEVTATTTLLGRVPNLAERALKGTDRLQSNTDVLLTIEHAAVTLTLDLTHPIILGRQVIDAEEIFLDLTDYGSFKLGVSRRHCRLERRGDQLVITDLASSNGTYVNGERMLPYREYVLTNGDLLTLGTLRMGIIFRPAESETEDADD